MNHAIRLIICFLTFYLAATPRLLSENKEFKSYIIKLKNDKHSETLQSSAVFKLLKPIFNFNNDIKNSKLLSSNSTKSLESYYIVDKRSVSPSDFTELNKIAESIEPNYIYTVETLDKQVKISAFANDPLIDKQWGLPNAKVFDAWNWATGKNVVVGVVDTGIDFNHKDLSKQLWMNAAEDINKNGTFEPWSSKESVDGVFGDLDGIDQDGNGYIDDVIGYDFVDQEVTNLGDASGLDPIPFDENQHGTIVSGVIAAERNNNIGISGIAYNAKILSARAFDASGNAESDDIAKAIIYAVVNGAKVINCSFGEIYYSRLIDDAIKFAFANNVVVVASSGNNNWDEPHYPSDLNGVISVGAMSKTGYRYWKSNYGSNLSLIAPGENIMTCAPNNNYGYFTGTSLSAPFVSAAAAMALEKNNKLSPSEIKSILERTASPYSNSGRTKYEGAGALDISAALEKNYLADIKTTYPHNKSIYNKNDSSFITVCGSILTPLFQSYSVSIGEGISPDNYRELYNNDRQVKDSIISKIDISKLKDTTYTIKISVNQKNERKLEITNIVEVISNSISLNIDSVQVLPVYNSYNGKYMINILANRKCFAELQYVNLSTQDTAYLSDQESYEKRHDFLLSDLSSGSEYEAQIKTYLNNGRYITKSIIFTPDIKSFDYALLQSSNYKCDLPAGYVINQTFQKSVDDAPKFVISDYKDGQWNSALLYSFENGTFKQLDSLIGDTLLPVAYANFDGDSRNYAVMKTYGKTAIFKFSDNKLFKNLVFSSLTIGTPCAAYDLDKDGKDELFAYTDSSIVISKFENGKVNVLFNLYHPNPKFRRLKELPAFTLGDFDNDGSTQIVFSNKLGNRIVFNYKNGNVEYLNSDTNSISINSLYYDRGDIDGDGKLELISLSAEPLYGSDAYEISSAHSIWKLNIYKIDANKTFKVQDNLSQNIFGVRLGDSGYGYYKNGLTVANIDGKNGDEIIVSTFPNLYIFKLENNNIRPFAMESNVYANGALTVDLNKNGINEVIFSGFDKLYSGEYLSGSELLTPPSQVWGWSINNTDYFIHWVKPAKSIKTQIWYQSPTNSSFKKMLAETDKDTITLNAPEYKNGFIYFISKYENEASSYQSRKFVFFIKEAAKAISAKVEEKSIIVKFDGQIPTQIESKYFKLIDSESREIYPSSTQYIGDYSVLLNFNDLEYGDYNLKIASFFDYYTNPTIASELKLSIQDKSVSEIYLKSLHVISANPPSIELSYSADVSDEAMNKNNYIITPIGEISKIDRIQNDKVRIEFVANQGIGAFGKEYNIKAQNIKSANNSMEITKGAGASMSFIFFNNELNQAYVFPNPIKMNSENRPIFANLPTKARIEIFRIDGAALRTLNENNADGGCEWDMLDNKGDKVESGVYLFKVIDLTKPNEPESDLLKFLIIK
jgi:subtilisin family serine protease